MTDATAATPTPISDLMAAHFASKTPESWKRFLCAFLGAQVGVVATGIPAGAAGQISTTADKPISVGLTSHSTGQPMVLVFADPDAFAARYGRKFNAAIRGKSALETALLNPSCAGILVNSALAEVSVVIERVTLEQLAQLTEKKPATKPWWRFW